MWPTVYMLEKKSKAHTGGGRIWSFDPLLGWVAFNYRKYLSFLTEKLFASSLAFIYKIFFPNIEYHKTHPVMINNLSSNLRGYSRDKIMVVGNLNGI